MDDDVARLAREERLVEAAELASARGDRGTASRLFEQACAWGRAAREALAANDPARALLLAVEARDEALAEATLPLIARQAPQAERLSAQLERRGNHAWAARLHEAAGRTLDAARAWERAGDAVRAASLLERAGDPAEAARVLEAAARRQPESWEILVALGALLVRYRKLEAAVRALQRVPGSSAERRRALPHLTRALEGLGLTSAAAEARRELEALGGAPEEAGVVAAAEPVRTRLYGRYEVVREVASSPTARVLECIDVVRHEHVAVKLFAAYDARGGGRDALARFEREVRVLGALDHPSVVPLRDYVAEGPALVLAWMEGGTLDQMLAAGPIAPARAVEIACAVLSALGEAHRLGVLHRDVKPGNVLFDGAGVARLGDFGVAHLGDLSTTATAGVIGTLAYMSPEQREGRPATVRSDIYGVGVMLREMLTGERPPVGEPPRTLPSAVHRDLDARHDELVLRLADPDPSRRPADAFATRRELTALHWPHTIELAAPMPRSERRQSERPRGTRLQETGGVPVDTWIGRAVERIPLTERSLVRAAAFARAGDESLQSVLRVDRDAAEIWLEGRRGSPLQRRPTDAERRTLEAALTALHEAGIAHGHVDADHVLVDEAGGVMLRFPPEADAHATVDLDRLALAAL